MRMGHGGAGESLTRGPWHGLLRGQITVIPRTQFIYRLLNREGARYLRASATGSRLGFTRTQIDWTGRDKIIWQHIIKSFAGRCAYCSVILDLETRQQPNSLTREHLRGRNPIELGLDHPGNVVPCCLACNQRRNKLGQPRWQDFVRTYTQNPAGAAMPSVADRLAAIHVHVERYEYPNLTAHEQARLRAVIEARDASPRSGASPKSPIAGNDPSEATSARLSQSRIHRELAHLPIETLTALLSHVSASVRGHARREIAERQASSRKPPPASLDSADRASPANGSIPATPVSIGKPVGRGRTGPERSRKSRADVHNSPCVNCDGGSTPSARVVVPGRSPHPSESPAVASTPAHPTAGDCKPSARSRAANDWARRPVRDLRSIANNPTAPEAMRRRARKELERRGATECRSPSGPKGQRDSSRGSSLTPESLPSHRDSSVGSGESSGARRSSLTASQESMARSPIAAKDTATTPRGPDPSHVVDDLVFHLRRDGIGRLVDRAWMWLELHRRDIEAREAATSRGASCVPSMNTNDKTAITGGRRTVDERPLTRRTVLRVILKVCAAILFLLLLALLGGYLQRHKFQRHLQEFQQRTRR